MDDQTVKDHLHVLSEEGMSQWSMGDIQMLKFPLFALIEL